MDCSFELFNLQSGNLVGSYATQCEAIEVVRRAFETHGPQAVQGLVLLRVDDDDAVLIEEELGLVQLAIGSRPLSRPAASPASS